MLGDLPNGYYLIGIDLNSCRDANGAIADWAQGVITRFGTYAEVSPSGTGVKLFCLLSADDMSKLLDLLGTNKTDSKQLTRKTFAAGKHREVAIDTARFYAITEQRLDDCPESFRLVPYADVEWFIKVAGPNYLQQQQSGNGHAPTAFGRLTAKLSGSGHQQDESGSGHGFRFMQKCRAEGMNYEAACEAILADEGDAGEWANRVDERQLQRAYERSTPSQDESGTVDIPETLCLSIADWLARDLPEPDFIIGDIISTTTRALLAADTGLGKSLFTIAMGMRGSLGMNFLRWPGRRPSRVLYIDGEMSRRLLRKRLAEEVARIGTRPDTFFALSSEDIPELQPLNTKNGQMAIEAVISEHCGGSIDLIIFDNIMALISGNHSEEEGWAKVTPWTRDLTRRGIGQLWVHHTGHDTARQYGTKLREWQMDLYMQLDKNEDEETDVSFTLSFRKARERTPENRLQFADTDIKLLGNKWQHEAGSHKDDLSPVGEKFFQALKLATTIGGLLSAFGWPTATIDKWKEGCVTVGLIDPEGKPDSARTLFNKYKLELITKNWVRCDATSASILP